MGKFAYEIEEEMSCDEFDNWCLYFDWKNIQQKEYEKKARAEANVNKRSSRMR